MSQLQDFDKIKENLKNSKKSQIVALHKFIFHNEGDRNNRKRLRTFEGFDFNETDQQFIDKRTYINNSLSTNDLVAACLVLDLSYDHEDIALFIFKNLQKDNLLAFGDEEEDDESDNEEYDDESVNREDDDETDVREVDDDLIDNTNNSVKEVNTAKRVNATMIQTKTPRFTLNFKDLDGSIREFYGDNSMRVEEWLQDFEETADIMQWDNFMKLVFAKKMLRGRARTFILGEKGMTSWSKLKTTLIEEFSTKVTSREIHQVLATKKMKKDESVYDYFYAMRDLAIQGSIEDRALIEYVIDGIADDVNKLVLYGATNQKQFKEKLRDFEMVVNKQKASSSTHSNKKKKEEATRPVNADKAPIKCFNCGSKGHKSSNCANKSKGTKCFNCNLFGHIAKDCKARKEDRNVNCLTTGSLTYRKVKIGNQHFNSLIDPGSKVNIMSKRVYQTLNKPTLNVTNLVLTGFGKNQNVTKPFGQVTQRFELDNEDYELVFQVTENDCMNVDVIIGTPLFNQAELVFNRDGLQIQKIDIQEANCNNEKIDIMKIDVFDENNLEMNIDHSANASAKEIITDMIKTYKPAKTKTNNVSMKIIINSEIPVYSGPRRLPLSERKWVDQQVDEWLKEGVVEVSESEYSSPIVLVKKKDGTRRLCVDYRRLNNVTVKDRYPLPLIEDQLDRLQDATIFCSIDLRNGFFHVDVHEDSRKYTAFVTHSGHYQFKKMPFGLCNSPAVFQRYINNIFRNLTQKGTALPYIDDVIIPAKTEEEAIENLKEVLTLCAEFGLEINFKKSQFLKRRIEFLGHVIAEQRIYPSPAKAKAMINYPVPTSLKQLESFLGLAGYFRKFIPDFAVIAKPLSDLRKKEAKFDIKDDEINAINHLKRLLSNSPVLKIFNEKHETELHTDASAHGFGAILMQRCPEDGKLHPTYYMSKKTTDAESKYTAYELEILAVVEALKKFRVYLIGIPFKIITDCNAFAKTMSKKDLSTRVARWLLLLQEYNYTIEHRSGSRMRHVDALSRNAVMTIREADTLSKLKAAQWQDEHLKSIFKILEQETNYDDYYVKAGILYKMNNDCEKVVVPAAMQYEIIRKAHDKGHFGVKKTKEIICNDYFIPNLDQKIQNCIDNCLSCLLVNKKRGKQEGELHSLVKPDLPLHTYHVDFLGPLESTSKAYKHILVVIDAFSKFSWLYPTKSTTTNEVITKLRLQSAVFGNPAIIITDRGTAFTSEDFSNYCAEEGIAHNKITTGLPRANGQVERLNSVIASVLSKLSLDDPTKWYRYVDQVQKIINSTFHRSINTTPFQIVLGTKMRNKDDVRIRDIVETEIINQFDNERDDLRNSAKQQISKIQDENRRTYNLRRKPASVYKVDDLVAVKRTQFGGGLKLRPKFLGPYRVQTVKYNDTYDVIKVGESEGPNRTTSCAEFMKPWPRSDYFGSKS